MIQGARRASAASTAGPGPDSSALLPTARPPRRVSARLARGGGRSGSSSGAPAEALVRRSDVAPCLTCGICGGLLRDATAFAECLDAFCRKCIYDKVAKENIRCCPTCGIHLGCAPLEKLRSMIFPSKRRKVCTVNKTKEKVSAELTLSSVVDVAVQGSTGPMSPGSPLSKAQKIEVEVIDEPKIACCSGPMATLNLAPIGRDALSRIQCRDVYSACSLSAETGALIVWQQPPNLEEMVANQLVTRQDPDSGGASGGAGGASAPPTAGLPKEPLLSPSFIFEKKQGRRKRERRKKRRERRKIPPVTSDTEYLGQAPTVQTTSTSVLADSSFHATMTVQDDEKLRKDVFKLFKESNLQIMGTYEAYINQLKAKNSKLLEQLENERAAALERTRTLEEKHQQELGNERAAAAERNRILEESHERDLHNEREAVVVSMRNLEKIAKRESQIALNTRSRNESLEAENARLYEELENERADNQALKSDYSEKCDELATLKYCCDMAESENTYLQNQVDHLTKELDRAKKEHARYVRQVLDAARAIPNNLETIHSDAEV